MKQYYAVIDTNVLVSALLATLKDKDSSPLKILHSILDGEIIPIFNDEIITEYREVLHRPKFHFPDEFIEQVLKAKMNDMLRDNFLNYCYFYGVNDPLKGRYL